MQAQLHLILVSHPLQLHLFLAGIPLDCKHDHFQMQAVTFNVKSGEVRALFNGELEPSRTAELQERMLAAGLPV
jgi:hypothetical protein